MKTILRILIIHIKFILNFFKDMFMLLTSKEFKWYQKIFNFIFLPLLALYYIYYYIIGYALEQRRKAE